MDDELIFPIPPLPRCVASVILPARDEAAMLPRALAALAHQIGVARNQYEILVLCNNCSDGSAEAARAFAQRHPEIALHVAERRLPPEQAHAGTARRLLMNAAAARLRRTAGAAGVIFSTDADTQVSPVWMRETFSALRRGADAVGGAIDLNPREMASLDPAARAAYLCDRRYQRCAAKLECLLDPHDWDRWPRHRQHFGASLACSVGVYERAGGMPPAPHLEDVAFVQALDRIDARLRHEPRVRVTTSCRLDGRAGVGLSWQLRTWRETAAHGQEWRVESAAFLEFSFRLRGRLRHEWRRVQRGLRPGAALSLAAAELGVSTRELRRHLEDAPYFHQALERAGYDAALERAFPGDQRSGPISLELRRLQLSLRDAAEIAAPFPGGTFALDYAAAS